MLFLDYNKCGKNVKHFCFDTLFLCFALRIIKSIVALSSFFTKLYLMMFTQRSFVSVFLTANLANCN